MGSRGGWFRGNEVMWDTIIIGAGPGGVSAAIWAHRLDLKTLLVDARDRIGGQLLDLYGKVLDYPGIPVERGYMLAPKFAEHLISLEVPHRLQCPVQEVRAREHTVVTGSREVLRARTLVLATGARRRRLQAEGVDRLWRRGISDSPTRDLDRAGGKVVGIVGGGDAALENALFLARTCKTVHVIHRRSTFRGRQSFQQRLRGYRNVVYHMDRVVESVAGDDWLRSVCLRGPGGVEELPLEMLFVKIGVVPNVALVKGQVETTPDGYVVVDRDQQTSVPGVYAVGDVCNPIYSSIAHAVGQGMVAAKAIERALSR